MALFDHIPASWRRGFALLLAVSLGVPALVAGRPATADEPQPDDRGDEIHLVATLRDGEVAAADAVTALVDTFAGHGQVLPRSGVVTATVPARAAEAAREALAAHPGVAHVERDVVVTAARTPNDPRYGDQWGLPRIEAPAAWSRGVGSPSVSIAVLDTGVDASHGDLSANIGAGHDVVGGGANQDRQGHGTKAAGVAAAVSNNAAGGAGVCWSCEIRPVKVLSDDGSGRHSHVAEGVRWAADHGIDVISLSLGGHGRTAALESAIADATAAGSVVVASAGNYGSSDPVYPAAYDDAIAVGAVDERDRRTSYSSYGDWVSVAAPGCTVTTEPGGGFGQFCGTSSAAPHVAGLAGLVRAADAGASAQAVRRAIVDGAHGVGQGLGAGRIDADRTVALAEQRRGDDGSGDGGSGDGDSGGGDDSDDGSHDPISSLRRIVGPDRFATAAALSGENIEPGVEQVYLVTGGDFADALAAGAAAGAHDAPVLLTGRDALPSVTATELARLEPGEVVIAGGEQAISDPVAAQASRAADAPVTRVGGADRFATAAQLAQASFSGRLGVAYLATGEDFADALAGVPASVVEGAPMLLTSRDTLPEPTRRALGRMTPRRVVILGGEQAVSATVRRQLRTAAPFARVDRLAGSDRYATAATISDAIFDADAVDAAALATGQAFPDALAAGPIAGSQGSPLLLTTRDRLPQTTADALRRASPATTWLLGGPSAVSDGVAASVGGAAR